MRKYFVLLSVLITTAINAQVFQFETMGLIKDKKSLTDVTFFNNNFYGIETEAKAKFGWTMTLEKVKMGCKLSSFDNKLNLVKENTLAAGKDIFGPFSPFFKEINKKLYLIYYQYESEIGIEVYTARVNLTTLELSDVKKVMTMDQKNVGLFKMVDLYNSYDLLIKTSPDKSKILFFWTSGVNSAFSYSVADSNMNVTRQGYQELENVKEFTIANMLIDNAGNFFGGFLHKKKDDYHPFLLAGTGKGDVKKLELTLDGTSVHDVYVSKGNNDDQVKVVGTCSKGGYYITGAFSQNMDKKNFKVSGQVIKDIPESLVEKFDNDSYAKTKKNNYGLYPQVQFDDFTMSDGTIMLAGDLTRYQNMGERAPVSPVKGSSLIIIFNATNDIVFNRLPKKEFLGLEKGNSFFSHKRGEKLMLLYTDLESNVNTSLEKAESASFASRKTNVLVAATIEKDGNISRRILHPNTSSSYYFSSGSTSSVDDNTLLLGLGKDKVRLTSIKTTYAFYMLKISDE
jgi:hypothetical protein